MSHSAFQYPCFFLYQDSIWKLVVLVAGLHFQEEKVEVGGLIRNTERI